MTGVPAWMVMLNEPSGNAFIDLLSSALAISRVEVAEGAEPCNHSCEPSWADTTLNKNSERDARMAKCFFMSNIV